VVWECDYGRATCGLRSAIEWSVFEVSWWVVGCDSGDGGDVMRLVDNNCAGVFERVVDGVWFGIAV
jgi:hypothetical protein